MESAELAILTRSDEVDGGVSLFTAGGVSPEREHGVAPRGLSGERMA